LRWKGERSGRETYSINAFSARKELLQV